MTDLVTVYHPWVAGDVRYRVLRAGRWQFLGPDNPLVEVAGQFTMRIPDWVLPGSVPPIVVPHGFRCDGASIPRPAWVWQHPFDSPHVVDYFVHDWFYRGGAPQIPRWAADRIMYWGLRSRCDERDGMRASKARVQYLFVRSPIGAMAWQGA